MVPARWYKNRRILIICCSLLLLLGVVFGYRLGLRLWSEYYRNEAEGEHPSSREDCRLESGAVIKYKLYNPVYHEWTEESTPVGDDCVGLTWREFQELHPDWIIEEFVKDRVVVSVVLPVMLGIKDGKVAVLTIKPDGQRSVIEVTEIEAARLPEQVRRDLTTGIRVYDQTQLREKLEGLSR